MRTPAILIHVIPGAIGIVAGFLALAVAKGGTVHRKSGLLFVVAMVLMAMSGAIIAARGGGEASTVAGTLATYMVVTGLTTVRPLGWSPQVDRGLMLLAVLLTLWAGTLGVEAVMLGGVREGIPAVVLFKFALIGLLASIGDFKVLRAGPLKGRPRLVRHLWRMCFSLYVASASFFLGQQDVLPAALRIPLLLAVPAFAPILAMFFWLWRMRVRRPLRRVVLRVPEVA